MSTARALLLFVCCAAVAVQAEYDVVDWSDAARCVGRPCGVRGTVVATESAGPTYRLFFDPDDHTVRIILMRGWMVDWPPYVGRTIIANGKVQRFRDHIEMIVLDPDDIAIIGGEPPATPEAPSPTESPTAGLPTALPPTEVPPTATPAAPRPPIVVPPPVVPPTVAAPPAEAMPTPTSNEVEQLRQRVRELEQRIEQLEGR